LFKKDDSESPISGFRSIIKAKAILFSTDYTAEIKDADVNLKGKMVVDGNEFDLDKIKPVLIEDVAKGGMIKRFLSKGKVTPYYFMKYDSVLPMMTQTTTTDTKYNISCPKCNQLVATWSAIRKTIEPLDMKSYKTMLPPDLMKDTIELRFLKVLKRYADRSEKSIGGGSRSMMIKLIISFGGAAVLWFVILPMLGIKFM
jgi:hypothetical protein